jgi:hypothetical protein
MYLRIGAVAVACATAGTAAGIATSSAKTATKAKATTSQARASQGTTGASGVVVGMRGHGPGGLGGLGGGAIHSVSVVANKAGTGFDTVTQDSGTMTSVDTTADTVTLTEGTSSTTYKDVTVTVPDSAKVYLDGAPSTLAKLAAKDRVTVTQSSDGTFTVVADDGSAPAGAPGNGGPPASGPASGTTGASGATA